MTEDTYNGWTNYETWCVNLWLTNEQGTDEQVREIVKQVSDWAAPGEDTPTSKIADAIKDYVDELAEMTCPGCIEGASFVTDLLRGALSDVDWLEIAQAFLDD